MDDKKVKSSDDSKKIATNGTGSAVGKEQEPVVEARGEAGFEEVGEHIELEKPKEVREHIKEIPHRPEIPREVERAGVRHAGPATPVKKAKGTSVNLPLTDDQIAAGLHAHVWESVRWLAVWCVRQLRKAHIIVKEAHGKLTRS